MNSSTEPDKGQELHSWQLVRIINNYSPLTAIQTRILMFLADHANREKGWKVWTSVALIAERCKVDEATVTRTTNLLSECGYLRKERAKSIPPRNDYYLNVDAISSMKSTNIAQSQVYTLQEVRFKDGTESGLNLATTIPIRLELSGYQEQARSLSQSVNVVPSKAGPTNVDKTHIDLVISKIPKQLIYNLCQYEDKLLKKGDGHFLMWLRRHVGSIPDADWTRCCWYALHSALTSYGTNNEVESPSRLVKIGAVKPDNMNGLPDYSEARRDRAVVAFNKKMLEG